MRFGLKHPVLSGDSLNDLENLGHSLVFPFWVYGIAEMHLQSSEKFPDAFQLVSRGVGQGGGPWVS